MYVVVATLETDTFFFVTPQSSLEYCVHFGVLRCYQDVHMLKDTEWRLIIIKINSLMKEY